MSKEFEDIRIVDLDIDRTRPSERGSGMRHMYLRLSTVPPHDWGKLFNNERSFARHSMWRKAWIEGQFIVVDCVPEEMERFHLSDLKQDTANSNTKFREHMARVEAIERQESEKQQGERADLQDLKKKLGFD